MKTKTLKKSAGIHPLSPKTMHVSTHHELLTIPTILSNFLKCTKE